MPQKRHPKLRDKDWLYDQYVVKCRSQEEIADMLGVSNGQVSRSMKTMGIPARSFSEAETLRWQDIVSVIPSLNDYTWLEEHYINKNEEPEQIAVDLDCTFETVLRAIRKYRIPIRSRSVKGSKLRKNTVIQLRDFDWLKEQYINKHRDVADIAIELGCSGHTVITYLKRWRIRRRESLYLSKEDRRKKNGNGYIIVFKPEHPNANSSGWIQEHRLIVSEILGRSLTKEEVVHHLNLKQEDNRPENLLIFSNQAKHKSFHENPPDWIPKCACCNHILHRSIERRPDDVSIYFG